MGSARVRQVAGDLESQVNQLDDLLASATATTTTATGPTATS